MKRNIKKFLLPVFAAVSVSFAACSDWTDTESLDIHYPSIEEQNPELYQQYLQALRTYKAREHKVVFVTMDNVATAPSQQNHHLTTIPDSVDFICLANPSDVHPMLVKEIQKVHEKGTRVVYNIDYAAIEELWKQKLEEEEANKPEEPETPDTPATLQEEGGEGEGGEGGDTEPEPETEETRFLKFCSEQTAQQLAYCDKFGFDGVVFSYTGRALVGMDEETLALYTARQEAFCGLVSTWHKGREDKLLFFQGNPQNLVDKSILQECAYIIIPQLKATSSDEFSLAILMASVEDVPTDRFIVGVTIPSITDKTDTKGYFAAYESDGKTQIRATKGAAQWTVAPASSYTKAGIAIADAQNDYYNLDLVYKNIREAISIMNPAPKK